MASDIDRFVLEANIERYRNLLTTNLSPATRETVTALLDESVTELQSLNRRQGTAWRRAYSESLIIFCGIVATLAQAV